jgi:D-alanyl-D-alanine carboxypeptidase (penicillin-binding protein 5/6)
MRLRPVLAIVLTCLLAWAGLIASRLGQRAQQRPGTVVAESSTAAVKLPLPWPAHGQAALAVQGLDGGGLTGLGTHGGEQAVPIASLAKMMTAYLVLRAHPLEEGERGFTVTVQDEDVTDYQRRLHTEQSVVPVRSGEVLDQRQLLEALLIPSGNNIAILLAVHRAGSVAAFVALMNDQAHALGMMHTRYTDPSGLDAGTVSTASDQLRLVRAAMALPAFASIVAMPAAELPVAGRVQNTNPLLGRPGVLGVKTGSHDAAGGCLAFAVRGNVAGAPLTLIGVVLGQRGGPLLDAAGRAAWRLADTALRALAARAETPQVAGQR